MSDFALDSRLEADSDSTLCELELCTVRLAKDANYPWLIMVPKVAGMAELIDLSAQDQHRLTDEIAADFREPLRTVTNCDKLNVAALGNMVRQLHVHVIARYEGDRRMAWADLGCEPCQALRRRQVLQMSLIGKIKAALG